VVRLSSKTKPRHDPKKIYQIHADGAAGLTTAEIAARHDLPPATVIGLLRPIGETCTLVSPYGLRHEAQSIKASVQVYWLGFIAASGRVFGQNHLSTLVLAIHPQEASHVQTLLQDLMVGHVTCEFADSSLYGRQAYVRDRQLAEMLLQWGVSGTTEDGSIPIEFIPEALIADFVRGYLEGSRHTPPFGGQRPTIPSPGSLRSLAVVGSAPMVNGLNRVLQSVCGTRAGVVRPFERQGLEQVVFPSEDGLQILAHAYRCPQRSMPRAARYVAWFDRGKRHMRRPSGDRPQRQVHT
jgi:hypothetical protein